METVKVTMLRKACGLADWLERYQQDKENNPGICGKDNAVIEKAVTLKKDEFEDFCKDFMADRKFITENIDKMYLKNEVWHCIKVTAPGSKYSVLIESEGYGYARYAAVIEN